MYLSSLPIRVDVGDWLDEDLPTVLGDLVSLVPSGASVDGYPDGYWSVAHGAGADAVGRDRVLAVVTDDDQWSWQLAGVIGNSAEFPI
jgi:hypothetical protein